MQFARSQSVLVAPFSGEDQKRIAALNAGERAMDAGAAQAASAAQLQRDLQTAAALAAVGFSAPLSGAGAAAPRKRFCTACGTEAPAGREVLLRTAPRRCRRRPEPSAVLPSSTQNVGPTETGAGGSGSPPGPAAKVSGETASCWPTPGLLQSQTPPGNTACRRASCAGAEGEPARSRRGSSGLSWHFRMFSASGPPATWRGDECFVSLGSASHTAMSVTGVEKVASPVR